CLMMLFFSSRSRHTRCYRDWSSDVCSSDLLRDRAGCPQRATAVHRRPAARRRPRLTSVTTAGPPAPRLTGSTVLSEGSRCHSGARAAIIVERFHRLFDGGARPAGRLHKRRQAMSVVPGSTLVEMFNNRVAATPDSVAMRTKTGGALAPLTYREF